MRHATRFFLIAVLALAAPAVAAQECTSATATDVTIRQINAIPQANIDALEAAGQDVTIEQAQELLTNDLEGECVRFTAVFLSDPIKSGLATATDGIPGRIHVFVRDVTAATDGVEGMGTQIVDGRGTGTIQQFFAGDEVTVVGTVSPFEGSGGVSQQIAPTELIGTGNAFADDDPLRQPVTITTSDIHDVYDVGGDFQTQIDWSAYSDFNGQYVRFENVELIQAVTGGTRVDALFSSAGDDAEINLYDTSVCFRNDRDESYFPAGQAPACIDDDFNPPSTGIINLQGFLSFQGDDGAFDYAVPDEANFVISPFEDEDFEIAVAPPIITLEDTGLATTADGALVRATVIPGTAGNTVASVTVNFTTSSGASGSIDLVNTAGDTYEATIPNLVAGDFVTYTVSATDNQGASTPVGDAVSRRVVDGAISSIFDVQATPDGGPGASGVTTSSPVAFDLDATVQSVIEGGSNFFATIQDDESLAPFTGVWVNFGETDPGLSVGDQINITAARVVEAFSLTQLRDVMYTVTGSGDPLGYKSVTTDLFNGADGAATAEQHEGMLLTFPNVEIVATNADDPAGPFGEFLFSSDGTEENAVRADDFSNAITYADNDPSELVSEGETREFVRGPLYFSFGNYKLAPTSLDDIGGLVVAVGTGPGEARVEIEAAYPNPTAGSVTVRFALAAPGTAVLRAFDATGREVATLADGAFSADRHEVSGSLEGLATGVYVLRLEAGGEVVTSRVAVVR